MAIINQDLGGQFGDGVTQHAARHDDKIPDFAQRAPRQLRPAATGRGLGDGVDGSPGWVTQAPTSVVLRPCESQEGGGVIALNAARPRPPGPSDRAQTRLADVVSHGAQRSGYVAARVQNVRPSAPMSWARFTPAATTAAAPVGKQLALPARPGSVGLYPGYVVNCSSTETNAATPSGAPRVVVQPGDPGRPGHAAQPGTAAPSGHRRAAPAAQRSGHQRWHRPLAVAVINTSRSSGRRPDSSSAPARVRPSHGFFDENLVRLADPVSFGVLQQDPGGCDFGAGAAGERCLRSPRNRDADKRVGELAL